mmetsp:Transcript_3118/g.5841  ORF Transcript_3118/g.5841 Transcript_3118/m.5841 type:complete len:468 (-) Transcript_3118:12-1415(-)
MFIYVLLQVAIRLGQKTGGGLAVEEKFIYLADVRFSDGVPSGCTSYDVGGGEHLHTVTKGRARSDLSKGLQAGSLNLDALHGGADGHDLHHLLDAVGHCSHDEHTVQKIDGDAVGCQDVSTPDVAHSAVCGEDDDWGEGGFEGAVEEGEALDVEHVHLINEENTGDQLGDSLVNVTVNDAVDLGTEFLRNLCLLGLAHGRHHGHNVLAALGLGIGGVEVVESHVLDNFLLLVHVALGEGDILLGLEIEFGAEGIAPSDALDRAAVGLYVDDVSHGDTLLLESVVDGRVQPQGLCALCGLEAHENVAHGSAVAPERVLRLLGCQLDNFSLVHLLALLDAQANGATEVLHKHLGLLDLARVHLGSNHGAEGNLASELLTDTQRKGGLSSSRGSSQKQSSARHLLGLDQVNDHAASLTSLLLADESRRNRQRSAVGVEAEALDVSVDGNTRRLGRRLNLFDLHCESFVVE